MDYSQFSCFYAHCKLDKYSSWRIGGYGSVFIPKTIEQLAEVMNAVDGGSKLFWIGLGSNLLFDDDCSDCNIIITRSCLKDMYYEQESGLIYAQAGLSCAKLAKFCVNNNMPLGGFWAGIPGTVGGALAMNAGAFGSETWDYVDSVWLMNKHGDIVHFSKSDFKYSYRSVSLPDGMFFIKASFRVEIDSAVDGVKRLKGLLKKRLLTQPIGTFNCGSVFKNPEGYSAGMLIEKSGLKGYVRGGLRVSEKHANFIINDGTATAKDAMYLISLIRDKVYDFSSVRLQPEVKIVSAEFDNIWEYDSHG